LFDIAFDFCSRPRAGGSHPRGTRIKLNEFVVWIANRVFTQIAGPRSGANRSFSQLNLYLCWCHEITIMYTNSQEIFWGGFYLDSAVEAIVGNFRGA
jgi:hypothetical protein